MTTLDASLRCTHADLTELRRSFALIGGLAVSAVTEPRFTRDTDLAVVVADDADAEALINELRLRGYAIGAVLEQSATGRLADAFRPPARGPSSICSLRPPGSSVKLQGRPCRCSCWRI